MRRKVAFFPTVQRSEVSIASLPCVHVFAQSISWSKVNSHKLNIYSYCYCNSLSSGIVKAWISQGKEVRSSTCQFWNWYSVILHTSIYYSTTWAAENGNCITVMCRLHLSFNVGNKSFFHLLKAQIACLDLVTTAAACLNDTNSFVLKCLVSWW